MVSNTAQLTCYSPPGTIWPYRVVVPQRKQTIAAEDGTQFSEWWMSTTSGKYVFSGVRPSSAAETLQNETAFEVCDALELAEVAAAEDGRTPVNRYSGKAAGLE